MKFFKMKDYLKSWSTWVLAGVTVVPVLDDNVQVIADILPDTWKPYFITGLGILGLVVRSIKQK